MHTCQPAKRHRTCLLLMHASRALSKINGAQSIDGIEARGRRRDESQNERQRARRPSYIYERSVFRKSIIIKLHNYIYAFALPPGLFSFYLFLCSLSVCALASQLDGRLIPSVPCGTLASGIAEALSTPLSSFPILRQHSLNSSRHLPPFSIFHF